MSSRLRIGLWTASAAVGIVSVALLAAPAGAAPAGAGAAGAPGNNGTVKIHDGPGEPAPEPRNEPQVCTFHVHAQHFDAGQVLTFTVRSWEPTGDRSVVLTGSITADPTGAGRDPVAGAYSLPEGHYRLTVDTGNGTPTQDKHKMFWVQCTSETTSPPPPPPTCPSAGCPTSPSCPPSSCPTSPSCPPSSCPTSPSCPPSSCPTTPSCPSPPGCPTTPTTPPTPTETAPTSSASTPATGGIPPGTPPPAGGLARTGFDTAGIVGLGLALVLAGVALLCTPVARRRLLGS